MRLLALFVVFFVSLVGAAPAAAQSPTNLASIEDPRRLRAIGVAAIAAGEPDQARAAFAARIERLEIASFLDLKAELTEALIAEGMGELETAASQYRAAVQADPLRVLLTLRILSQHPDRETLAVEVLDHVRGLARSAKQGATNAQIYTTKKGDPRHLTVMTTQQVVERARRGEITRYCYVDELDFTKVEGPMPEAILMQRCVIGKLWGPEQDFRKLVISKSFVLGETAFGKVFEGPKHRSKNVQPATFDDLNFRETVFMGRAGFAGVEVENAGRAYFPMVVFEAEADFKGAKFTGVTEFRFASFGAGANFRFMRMMEPVYFGGTRYRTDTVFSEVFSARTVYFNEAFFEGNVSFDDCEFDQSATFESSRFGGKASFGTTRVKGTLNLSRAVFEDEVNVKEVHVESLDALGTHFKADAWFMDATIDGRSRFSLDEVTRHAVRENLDELLQIYRDYQGDEDSDEPLTTKSSYGVTSLDDLSARIDRNIQFANTRFGGFTVFEAVQFGTPGVETVASFFNAQFQGETHFEKTVWTGQADFTTIFGREVAFNNAQFDHSLILDDANVAGRVTLTDAVFGDDADLSFYGAEIASFEINPNQVTGKQGHPHRLFYEACARGDIDTEDTRIDRILAELDDPKKLRQVCYDFVVDEFVTLKESFGERAMTSAEDDAYWWTRHYETMMALEFGTIGQQVSAGFALVLFEWAFGWGVQLVNLGLASAIVTVVFALLYRWLCPDTVLVYDGQNIAIRDVSFVGLCFVSLQSLIAINTGWDFGDDDHTFRYLNTLETLVGFIVLTFFVGAYTRMILA